jgi:hypothetical protein
VEYDTHDQLRSHLADFVTAYNFACRLKTLKELMPYEYICQAWTKDSERFNLNPLHHMPGLIEGDKAKMGAAADGCLTAREEGTCT